MRTLKIAAVLGVLAACAPTEEDAPPSAVSNVVTDVPSPNAKATSAYLKSRRLDSLARLGVLTGNVERLAARADGTFNPAAADGKLALDELLALDKPENLSQLLPQERAVLPTLWSFLETTKDEPTELTLPALDVITATDVSVPAGEVVEPALISVASLKTELQRIARRLEQAHDSDDKPETITRDDLAAVFAAPAGFQPWEVAQLKTIEAIFRERSGTQLVAKVRVTTPMTPPYTLPAEITWGPASIGISRTIEYIENRTMDLTSGSLSTTVTGHVARSVKVTMSNPNQLLIIDDATGEERFASSGVLEIGAGTKTVEVWNGNARVGSFRSNLPRLASEDTNVDLSKFTDYAFVIEDDKALNHHSDKGTQTETAFTCSYKIEKDGYDSYVEAVIQQGVANPPFNVAAGRYVLPASDALGGPITLELYPEGIVKVSRANGWTERARYQNRVWTLPDGSDLSFTFDPSTNTVTVRKSDETLIFQGSLSGSLRTG